MFILHVRNRKKYVCLKLTLLLVCIIFVLFFVHLCLTGSLDREGPRDSKIANAIANHLICIYILLCLTIFWNRTLRLLMDVHFIWLISLFLWTPFFYCFLVLLLSTVTLKHHLIMKRLTTQKRRWTEKKSNEKINTRGTLLILVFKRFCNILYKVRLQKDF